MNYFRLKIYECRFAVLAILLCGLTAGAAPTRFDGIIIGTNLFSATINGGMLFNGQAFVTGGSGAGGASMPKQTISIVTAGGTTGIVFNGAFVPSPQAPATPTPDNGALNVVQTTGFALSWSDTGTGFGVATGFDVFTNGVQAATNTTATSLLFPRTDDGTQVVWQVLARNASGTTTGAVWSFVTMAATNTPPPGTNSIYITGGVSTTVFGGGNASIFDFDNDPTNGVYRQRSGGDAWIDPATGGIFTPALGQMYDCDGVPVGNLTANTNCTAYGVLSSYPGVSSFTNPHP